MSEYKFVRHLKKTECIILVFWLNQLNFMPFEPMNNAVVILERILFARLPELACQQNGNMSNCTMFEQTTISHSHTIWLAQIVLRALKKSSHQESCVALKHNESYRYILWIIWIHF